MPSVRDKYRATVQGFRRADSIPERFNVFRQAWTWLLEGSRTTFAFFGIIILPIYLIIIGSVWFDSCGEQPVLTLPLILLGALLIVCASYLPIHQRAKQKAREARENANIDFHGSLTPEEIQRFVPLRMNRVSNYCFLAILAVLPYMTIKLFVHDGDETTHYQCHPVVYWTAFVISIVYLVWLVNVLLACFLTCCGFVVMPSCIGKCKGEQAEDV
uniref:Uncharacterized protein n=1 Tax=Caenorhabditis japonica TaxID=281687 RepID=A0A8R1EJ82_CAEJA